MRLKRILPVLCVVLTVPLHLRAENMPQPKVEYSADSIMEAQGMAMASRVYHAPNKERIEMTGSEMNSIMISRLDKKTAWMLMPDQKMYMEMDLKEAKKNSKDMSDCRISQKSLGSETVNGFKTTKNKITMTCPDDLKYDGHMWVTKDGIMMKMDAVAQTEDGAVQFRSELKNLKIGRQDPKLFEVPAGYEKMSLGGMFDGGMSFPGASQPQGKKVKKPVSQREEGRSYTAKPRKKGSSQTGRSYTAEPRNADDENGGGRSYTAEPRDSGRSYTATERSNPLADPVNKIRNFLGF